MYIMYIYSYVCKLHQIVNVYKYIEKYINVSTNIKHMIIHKHIHINKSIPL